jgi:hypothetical protein
MKKNNNQINYIVKKHAQRQQATEKLENLKTHFNNKHYHDLADQAEILIEQRKRIDQLHLEKGEHKHQHGKTCEPCIKEIRETETRKDKIAVLEQAPGCNYC